MKNAGWQFYRQYYHWLEGNAAALEHFVQHGKFSGNAKDVFFKTESDSLLDFQWSDRLNLGFFDGSPHGFTLKTTYPGLLVGSGYGHQTGSLGEFKLGFFFDHATGLPVIPGSSVKGLLRSAFPGRDERPIVRKNKTEFIQQLTEKEGLDVAALEAYVFDGAMDGDHLPLHQRDIFLDAHIVGTDHPNGKIFFDDYITPHDEDPLKNPVPVRFLKIGPGVQFRFNFDLKNTGVMKAKDKETLFAAILTTFGIGAKTNVGYGQLTPVP